jgi:hypothetical protein
VSWFQGRKNGTHASSGTTLPLARTDDLVVEELGAELLVYDKLTNTAHSLNATAARVWRACDGYTNTDVLSTKLEMDSETLEQALYELENTSLMVATPQLGHTRREMTVKMAKYGAAASIPFIYSALGPVPLAAATPTPQQCLFYSAGDCNSCSNICGCCCCCQGCSNFNSSCKVCYPTSLCGTASAGSKCVNVTGSGGCTDDPHCSDTAKPPPKCVQPCTVPCVSGGSAPCGCAGVSSCT